MVPSLPEGAATSIEPVMPSNLPETSTNPPSPPFFPPLARIVPAIVVWSVDSTTTVPPFPFRVALAAITAPGATVTLRAVGCPVTDGPPTARASVVPIATVPPPALPDALIRAPWATATAPVVFISTVPPVRPEPRPSAVTRPVTATSPPRPDSITRPVRPAALLAEITPPALTSVCTTPSTASALRDTVPPRAETTPVFVTSARVPSGAVRTCRVTLMPSMPSP